MAVIGNQVVYPKNRYMRREDLARPDVDDHNKCRSHEGSAETCREVTLINLCKALELSSTPQQSLISQIEAVRWLRMRGGDVVSDLPCVLASASSEQFDQSSVSMSPFEASDSPSEN